MTWHDYIKVEQLPEDYQLVVEKIGLDATVKLAYGLPSVHLYLKSPDRLFQLAKETYILAQFAQAGPEQPFNVRRIALEVGMSEGFVYQLIQERKDRGKQLEMFSAENCN